MTFKRQRVRDPLHNLIEFNADEFESTMWSVIQTPPFQRLRRVKQLGFSELVYPGATHTRFAHSIGVFHTARQLVEVIRRHLGPQAFQNTKAQIALAAALLHDVGHGPFSHAFEDVGRQLKLRMANHEHVSDSLIRNSDLTAPLQKMGSGFASDVADLVGSSGPQNIFAAIVSSQFDADRLDYMRRDRLMSGTYHGAIDFEWLLSNIETGEVEYGVDDQRAGKVDTFVLGPKAIHAAESYVLGLFQLYPTVYFHKTTRGAEKLFSAILAKVIELCANGSVSRTGLPANHPLTLFAKEPENIDRVLSLDDTVIWGALSMMAEATENGIAEFARRLRDRRLLKCLDVRERSARILGCRVNDDAVDRACLRVQQRVSEWQEGVDEGQLKVLWDTAKREPYRQFQESKGPLNQIMIRSEAGELQDLAKVSQVVAAIEPFKLFRLYFAREDVATTIFIENVVADEVRKADV